MRYIGTTSRGIRTPIIKAGDNLEEIIVDSVLTASKKERFQLRDRDIIGITEAVVSIANNNYVTCEDVTEEIRKKFGNQEIGLVFPILSRNRFSLILEAIINACEKVHILFSYPSDEVGNHIIDPNDLLNVGINEYQNSFGEKKFRSLFGYKFKHEFTGLDYIEYYKSLGHKGQIIPHFSNDPRYLLKFTKNILCCDIHTRAITKKTMKEAGAEILYGLEDICTRKRKHKGYNKKYGLLGSNKVTENKLKLFPREEDSRILIYGIQKKLKKLTGKEIEIMVYGDGAFKDPVGKIWELADPVVSPAFTKGLEGRPKEIKLKYVSENWNKDKEDLDKYVKQAIEEKHRKKDIHEKSFGTTPRQLTDLLGSLCDLTSGSGDKGTPIVLIQGYFDDYLAK